MKMGYAYNFITLRDKKPNASVIEIKGSYHAPVTYPYLEGLLDIAGGYIDGLRFMGCSQRLHHEDVLKKIIKLCHSYDVYVSTGGMIERVIGDGPEAVNAYLDETEELNFDIVEISSCNISIPLETKVELVKVIQKRKMHARPEICFTTGTKLRYMKDVHNEIQTLMKAGAKMFLFNGQGITKGVKQTKWKKKIVAEMVKKYGLHMWMFDADEADVFTWYLDTYGSDVNLFIDHSQILQYESLRSQLSGDPKSWIKNKLKKIKPKAKPKTKPKKK